MEKGPVLSDGMLYQALQKHLFLYEPQDFPCENTSHIVAFSPAVTLFWTWEQKAQLRWTVKKDSEECSVQTAYYDCEVHNDKPCFWQFQR